MRKISPIFLAVAALLGALGVAGLTQAASGSATVGTLAGASIYTAGASGETGWYNPSGAAVSSSGDLYVADEGTNLIRKINTSTGAAINFSGHESYAAGSPRDIEFDANGNLYVVDYLKKVWKVTPSGTKTLHYDGSSSDLQTPNGIAVSASGDVFIADYNARVIRKITSSGTPSVFAGSGTQGTADGVGTAASFNKPMDIDISADGTTLYVSDSYGANIRAIDIATVTVSTIAGNGTSDLVDGVGTAASFVEPTGLQVSGTKIYVADTVAIRSIDTTTNTVATVAGSLTPGYADGTGASAQFYDARYIAASGDNIFVVETASARVRKVIASTGATTVLSGIRWGVDGTGAGMRFDGINDVALPSSDGKVWVSDDYNLRRIDPGTGEVTTAWSASSGSVYDVASNPSGTEAYFVYGNSIKKITSAGVVTDVAGSFSNNGFQDGTGAAARFNSPKGISMSSDGTFLLVADQDNNRIRKVILATGEVTTFLGTGVSGHTDGSSATAVLSKPIDVAVTPQGVAFVQLPDTFIVASTSNNSVRFLRNSDSTVVTLLAMSGVTGTFKMSGSSCSTSVCDSGALFVPRSVSYDSVHQTLLVGGYGKILGLTSTPEVFSLAGSSAVYRGAQAYKDGASSAARFTTIGGLSVLSDGSILVADGSSNVMRKLSGVAIDVTPSTSTTTTTTTPSSSTTAPVSPSTTVAPTTTVAPAPISTLPTTKAPNKGSAVVVSKDGTAQTATVNVSQETATVTAGSLSMSLAKGDGFTPASLSLSAGKTLLVSGSGFKPSTTVEIWLFSTPTLLGSATVSADGSFSKTVTVPSGLTAGSHTLQVEGSDSSGAEKALLLGVSATSASSESGTDLPFTGPLSNAALLVAASLMGFLGIFFRRRTA